MSDGITQFMRGQVEEKLKEDHPGCTIAPHEGFAEMRFFDMFNNHYDGYWMACIDPQGKIHHGIVVWGMDEHYEPWIEFY